MKYVDLSYTLDNSTAVSPLDNKIKMKRVKFLDKDYYNDTEITTTMHIGTHIDAPSHMLDSNINISDINMSKFIGKGILLNFENQKEIVLREDDKEKIVEDSIILIYTNMDKKIGTEEYYLDHPIITKEFCDFLVAKKVKILALDFYSPDKFPLTIHKTLLGNDILIVENIKDAHLLKNINDFKLYLIPIKIKAEGAFIRAFAEIK